MKALVLFLVLLSVLIFEFGCGVKSKPLAPLKVPWISTGNIEKDKEKKYKNKRPAQPADERAEFNPSTSLDEKER
ncbi:MAG: hypothetical protein B7Y39_19255 [Bdellovibrio sp. 28-41-41]|nr:MAG: hypothetical protein B7Y39_19255 [Bdellovibrio sp. 28-41-41]